MNILLISKDEKETEEGEIIEVRNKNKLPTMQDGWRFDFRKNFGRIRGARAFIIISKKEPTEIQGCIIYQMKEKRQPYLAYIESAPHNRHANRKYSNITGFLIAFACRLSFEIEDAFFKGWLAFDVMETNERDSNKLMSVYCTKYKAQLISGTTTMLIEPKDGIELIKKYLNQ